MTDIQEIIKNDRSIINRQLKCWLNFNRSVPTRLAKAMRYVVLGSGKRIRPIIALESFNACGGKRREWIIPFCCGLEFVHNFSLIHDDLPSIDNDDYRRGKLTLHKKFDEATAIIAGDALLAQAFELFALSKAPAGRKIKAIKVIASAIGPKGMAGGQMLDIYPAARNSRLYVARLKTAELIAVSIVTGAIIAGVDDKFQNKLYRLGINLGILFQLTDDLLDWHNDYLLTTVGDNGNITGLRKQAENFAQRTENGFRSLGSQFEFFVQLTRLILNRKD